MGVVVKFVAVFVEGCELLEPDRFATVRSAVEKIENRAVFEIPDILARLLR